jgi:hypothetical protein
MRCCSVSRYGNAQCLPPPPPLLVWQLPAEQYYIQIYTVNTNVRRPEDHVFAGTIFDIQQQFSYTRTSASAFLFGRMLVSERVGTERERTDSTNKHGGRSLCTDHDAYEVVSAHEKDYESGM